MIRKKKQMGNKSGMLLTKEERLEIALRENLKRRKLQANGRRQRWKKKIKVK